MGTISKKHKPKHKGRAKKRSHRLVYILAATAVITAGGYYLYTGLIRNDPKPVDTNAEVIIQQNLPEEKPKTGNLKTFTGEEFKNLYNNFAYPNSEYISEDAVITGDLSTDTSIRTMAEARGYIRRSAPVQNTFLEVQPEMVLQERASQPWLDLKAKAKSESIDLFLTAAYRSADEQRSIFLERIGSIGLTKDLIKSGKYNTQLDGILASTAIPGYSRHHTGYTIDIGCGNDPNTAFELTVCFDWLSLENYKNAKTFGWIPSYPEGAGQQGPEPETWEYVWVGNDAVTE